MVSFTDKSNLVRFKYKNELVRLRHKNMLIMFREKLMVWIKADLHYMTEVTTWINCLKRRNNWCLNYKVLCFVSHPTTLILPVHRFYHLSVASPPATIATVIFAATAVGNCWSLIDDSHLIYWQFSRWPTGVIMTGNDHSMSSCPLWQAH